MIRHEITLAQARLLKSKVPLTENSAWASNSISPSSESIDLLTVDFPFRLNGIVQVKLKEAFVFATHDLSHIIEWRCVVCVGRSTD
jgi:hypothetical protein